MYKMYKMDISIGSYKVRVEILVALVVVFWIMFGHLLCGCCRMSLFEGFKTGKNAVQNAVQNVVKNAQETQPETQPETQEETLQALQRTIQQMQNATSQATAPIQNNFTNLKEGFTGANNTSMGPEFASVDAPKYIMNPSTWSMPTLTYSPGTTPDAGVKAFWDRPKQQIPPPEGQLDFFAKTEFKPECCPNTFSTSTGCACLDMGSYNFLKQRGGNNVPFSEF